VNLLKCSDRDKRIVAMLVDTLDDDGYLTQSLDELAMLPAETEIDRGPADRTRHLQRSNLPASARDLASAWRCSGCR
jgi:RNA polymerase sigma-54 factor